MQDIELRFPVHMVGQRLLLPAGTRLTHEVLEELSVQGRADSHQIQPIMKHGRVKGDIIRLLQRPPYDAVFSDFTIIREIITMMEMVHLASPLLQSLDYFKEHDYHTYCHILVVFALSTLLARDLIPNHREQLKEAVISHTHDIGKICVPLHILKKTTPLTKKEREVINHHPTAGYVLLSYYLSDYGHPSARVARDHHERRDGSGHPRGIELRDPTIEIVVASDIYDALLSPRPYRNTVFDNRTALEEITKMAEMGKINWPVVRALVARNRKSNRGYQKTDVSTEKRGVPPSKNCYGVTAEEDKNQ